MKSESKKVLAALDGSRASLDVVSYLSNVLPRSGVQVVLFSVRAPKPESFWDFEDAPEKDPLDIWAARRKKTLYEFMEKSRGIFVERGFDPNDITMKVADRTVGIARDIILESRRGYDALAAGRVGMNPITRVVIGSVANKLVDGATHIPLWLVTQAMKNGKFLVALDSSKGAMKCVEHAGKMLADTDAEFTLFHVLRDYDFRLSENEDDLVTDMEKSRWFKITDEELGKARKKMHDTMLEAKDRLVQLGVSAGRINTKVLSGMATRGGSIAAQALLGGYGTIMIGRRGLSEVGEFNMGRVCHKVVQLANETAVWVVS